MEILRRRSVRFALAMIAIFCVYTLLGGNTDKIMVGVGDSYASGEGLAPYEMESGNCDRSLRSAYPVIAGGALNYKVTNNSCSGATTETLRNGGNGQPGQLTGMKHARIVSVTIGGNDVNALGAVLNTPSSTDLQTRLAALQPKLEETYRAIEKAAPNARVIVVGYPNIVSVAPTPSCFIKPEAKVVLHDGVQSLNKTIEAAAKVAKVEFVDTTDLFKGHELCTEAPWVSEFDASNPKAALHPTAYGQSLIAKALQDKIQLG